MKRIKVVLLLFALFFTLQFCLKIWGEGSLFFKIAINHESQEYAFVLEAGQKNSPRIYVQPQLSSLPSFDTSVPVEKLVVKTEPKKRSLFCTEELTSEETTFDLIALSQKVRPHAPEEKNDSLFSEIVTEAIAAEWVVEEIEWQMPREGKAIVWNEWREAEAEIVAAEELREAYVEWKEPEGKEAFALYATPTLEEVAFNEEVREEYVVLAGEVAAEERILPQESKLEIAFSDLVVEDAIWEMPEPKKEVVSVEMKEIAFESLVASEVEVERFVWEKPKEERVLPLFEEVRVEQVAFVEGGHEAFVAWQPPAEVERRGELSEKNGEESLLAFGEEVQLEQVVLVETGHRALPLFEEVQLEQVALVETGHEAFVVWQPPAAEERRGELSEKNGEEGSFAFREEVNLERFEWKAPEEKKALALYATPTLEEVAFAEEPREEYVALPAKIAREEKILPQESKAEISFSDLVVEDTVWEMPKPKKEVVSVEMKEIAFEPLVASEVEVERFAWERPKEESTLTPLEEGPITQIASAEIGHESFVTWQPPAEKKSPRAVHHKKMKIEPLAFAEDVCEKYAVWKDIPNEEERVLPQEGKPEIALSDLVVEDTVWEMPEPKKEVVFVRIKKIVVEPLGASEVEVERIAWEEPKEEYALSPLEESPITQIASAEMGHESFVTWQPPSEEKRKATLSEGWTETGVQAMTMAPEADVERIAVNRVEEERVIPLLEEGPIAQIASLEMKDEPFVAWQPPVEEKSSFGEWREAGVEAMTMAPEADVERIALNRAEEERVIPLLEEGPITQMASLEMKDESFVAWQPPVEEKSSFGEWREAGVEAMTMSPEADLERIALNRVEEERVIPLLEEGPITQIASLEMGHEPFVAWQPPVEEKSSFGEWREVGVEAMTMAPEADVGKVALSRPEEERVIPLLEEGPITQIAPLEMGHEPFVAWQPPVESARVVHHKKVKIDPFAFAEDVEIGQFASSPSEEKRALVLEKEACEEYVVLASERVIPQEIEQETVFRGPVSEDTVEEPSAEMEESEKIALCSTEEEALPPEEDVTAQVVSLDVGCEPFVTWQPPSEVEKSREVREKKVKVESFAFAEDVQEKYAVRKDIPKEEEKKIEISEEKEELELIACAGDMQEKYAVQKDIPHIEEEKKEIRERKVRVGSFAFAEDVKEKYSEWGLAETQVAAVEKEVFELSGEFCFDKEETVYPEQAPVEIARSRAEEEKEPEVDLKTASAKPEKKRGEYLPEIGSEDLFTPFEEESLAAERAPAPACKKRRECCVPCVLPPPKRCPPEWCCNQWDSILLPKLLSVQHVWGDQEETCIPFATNYTTVEAIFAPEYCLGRIMPMLDVRGHRFDNNTYAANAGLGGRYIPNPGCDAFCEILGFNAYYDYRQGCIGYYHQVGAGIEILNHRWDLRANAYAPFGAKKHIHSCTFEYPGDYWATRESIESISYSFNAELGWLMFDHCEQLMVYAAAGPYFLARAKCDDGVVGFEARIRPQFRDYLALDLSWRYDRLFQTIWQVGIVFNLPLYQISGRNRYPCGLTDRQIYQPVQRFEVMPLSKKTCWETNF